MGRRRGDVEANKVGVERCDTCGGVVDYSELIKRVGDLVERLEGGLGVWVVPYFVRELLDEVLRELREVLSVLKGSGG